MILSATGHIEIDNTHPDEAQFGLLPAITVGSSGTVVGNGVLTINGNIDPTSPAWIMSVFGTLAPQGTLTIDQGNLDLTAQGQPFPSSNTICNVTPTSHDYIQITHGSATLGGRLTVNMIGTFTPGPPSILLLHSQLGLHGTRFDSYSISRMSGVGPCFNPTIIYDANNVYLYLQPCATGDDFEDP